MTIEFILDRTQTYLKNRLHVSYHTFYWSKTHVDTDTTTQCALFLPTTSCPIGKLQP